jgi:hypothetical protein
MFVYQISLKIRLMWAELFHAGGRTDRRTDRQTDMAKPTVAFSQFFERAQEREET